MEHSEANSLLAVLACLQVVLLLDVDFWPSIELSELMQKPSKYQSLLQAVNNKNAIVLPAFETADSGDIGVEVAREVVLGRPAYSVGLWCGCRMAACAAYGRNLGWVPLAEQLQSPQAPSMCAYVAVQRARSWLGPCSMTAASRRSTQTATQRGTGPPITTNGCLPSSRTVSDMRR